MLRLALVGSIFVIALPLWAAEANRIDIRALARNQHSLIGERISTHGCLVNTPHGSFIWPCGSRDWHELTLIADPKYLGEEAFRKLGINFASHVEGDFTGVLVEITDTRPGPEPDTRVFLKLESIANARAYTP